MECSLNEIKKNCITINVHGKDEKETIVVTPSYNKTYGFEDYCHYGCEQRNQCNKPNWKNCNLKSKIPSKQIHVTRHNKYSHETVRINGQPVDNSHPMKDYYAWEREDLQNLSDYELIDCLLISPAIIWNDIASEYKKQNKTELILSAYENVLYIIYIFVKPKNSNNLYNDLDKYSIEHFIAERKNYDIVIAVQMLRGFTLTAVCSYRGVYLSEHKNNGIGNFEPIYK